MFWLASRTTACGRFGLLLSPPSRLFSRQRPGLSAPVKQTPILGSQEPGIDPQACHPPLYDPGGIFCNSSEPETPLAACYEERTRCKGSQHGSACVDHAMPSCGCSVVPAQTVRSVAVLQVFTYIFAALRVLSALPLSLLLTPAPWQLRVPLWSPRFCFSRTSQSWAPTVCSLSRLDFFHGLISI